jgi:hypothetical protein
MATNFHLAPPPKTVDGLLAVPIDISSLDATLMFDGATSTAAADATITYTMGPTSGNPIFDLRQTITQAWLDGAPFAPAALAHHTFGSESFTDLRVIESLQAASSVHTLRVRYNLALPDSEMGGAYLPAIDWLAGPKLRFVFGLSDLNRARYAEAWLPANLIFDQFSISLEIEILNTMAAHAVITNAAVTALGTNHWRVEFPARFSAVSPLLEVRAADTLQQQTGTVALPVSGKTVTIEAWKPAGSPIDLGAQIDLIRNLLTANENDYGSYLHNERFVAFFNGGGMEYEGGTTTSDSTRVLAHETFHSWYARGIKPASQADGWWDEAFTSFHDDGANDTIPFDFTKPPIVLCSRDPWQRHTPRNSYTDGSDFWKGMASLVGVANLNSLMGDLYDAYKGNSPVSTAMIEETLLSRSGNAQVVSAFHRFVYGLTDPSAAPDLWIKDEPDHTGADEWGGAFWDSPDLWIRNQDDGGTEHQSPEYGQDNWFHARVRNKAAVETAQHFVVTFHSKGFAGTEFVYPGDFLPSITARAEFDLPPGDTRIIRARWPRSLIPAAGSHTCLLASIISRFDPPVVGRHVWEHNNLAQKNLTIVHLLPNTYLILPVVITNSSRELGSRFDLEILTRQAEAGLEASVVHPSKAFFGRAKNAAKPFLPTHQRRRRKQPIQLDCGGRISDAEGRQDTVLTSDVPNLLDRFPDSWEMPFTSGDEARIPVDIDPFSQTVVGLKVAVPPLAEPGRLLKLHFVQRRARSRQIVGGVAVQVHVRETIADHHGH